MKIGIIFFLFFTLSSRPLKTILRCSQQFALSFDHLIIFPYSIKISIINTEIFLSVWVKEKFPDRFMYTTRLSRVFALCLLHKAKTPYILFIFIIELILLLGKMNLLLPLYY